MKPTNLSTIEGRLAFGRVELKNSTDTEDRKQGIDGWIGKIPIAIRTRTRPFHQSQDISIRKHNTYFSEYDKILAGKFKSVLYIFDFPDAYVICRTEDIRVALEMKLDVAIPNKGDQTVGRYISTDLIPCLILIKARLI